MYQYHQIIFRLRLGETARAIARAGLAGRRKIQFIQKIAEKQGWLDHSKCLPEDHELESFFETSKPAPAVSKAKHHEEFITQSVKQGIQASTIHAALVRQYNFSGSYYSVLRLVRKIKGSDLKFITMPLDFKPGEAAQVDFGAGPKLINPDNNKLSSTWIFVMVLAWSRHLYAEIVFDQKVETWLKCHRHAFEFFNGVPQKIIIDNPKCAITRACYYDPEVQRAYGDFAEGYGFIISACPPREPKKKGRVESGVKYVKRNFVPLRDFKDITDANKQLQSWILETAGNRIHGSTREKPLVLFTETEKALLKILPEKPPEYAVWVRAKVHGDCHIQFEKCRYSAPYSYVKQKLWVKANETTIRIYKDNTLVALHPRLFNPGKRNTLSEHLPPNGTAYLMRDPQWCLHQSKRIGASCHQLIEYLFASTVLDNLRAAQGIINLEKKYGEKRLEAACHRALIFESPYYRTVKSILVKGLEYQILSETNAFDELASTYTGAGEYSRDPSTILQ